MTLSFQHHHGAMLLKYSGISFISGAVNHGFFSGERSLWTALIGIVLFVAGAIMEHRLTDDPNEPRSNLVHTLLMGTLLSIGLGFFTGGLQHFPDSPARSAWVVPLGFVISVMALALNGSFVWQASSTVYTVLVGAAVGLGSYGTWQWLDKNPTALPGHAHQHGDTTTSGGSAMGDMASLTVDRVIAVRMDDRMRFTPDTFNVKAGETIRFVVTNEGKVLHEMVLGSPEDLKAHAKEMAAGGHHHGHDAHAQASGLSVQVDPGQTKEWVVQFAQSGQLQMACLVPGHYEAGMKGQINIQ